MGLGASIPESLNPVEDDDFFGLPQDAELQHLIPKGLNVSLKSGPELKPTLTPCESVYSSRAVSFASSESLETGGMAFTATDLIDHDGMDVDGDMEMDIDPMMRVARSIDKHHKKLFGDGGWLESPQASANAVRKSTGFKALGKKFKQQLAEIVSAPAASNIHFRFVSDPFILDRGCGEGQSALECHHARLPGTHRPGEALLRARTHDLQHCQRVPGSAVLRRPRLYAVHQQGQPLLGSKEPTPGH